MPRPVGQIDLWCGMDPVDRCVFSAVPPLLLVFDHVCLWMHVGTLLKHVGMCTIVCVYCIYSMLHTGHEVADEEYSGVKGQACPSGAGP